MSEGSVTTSRTGMLARLVHPYRLSIASLLVFLIGVPTIFLTRFAFYLAQPEYFARKIPTISKTSTVAPGSYVFLAGMLAAAACIVISWWLTFKLSRERAQQLPGNFPRRRLYGVLAASATALGATAAICLALLAIVTLKTHNPAHIALSYAFFITQLSAFLADTCAALLLNRALAAQRGDTARYRLNGKPAVCATTIVLGLFFLLLYLTRHKGIYTNEMTAQGVYVISEYVLATLCFSYAALYFPELRRHFRDGFIGSIAGQGGLEAPMPLGQASKPTGAYRA